ncbi:MAG: tRNA 2-thiocytidine biosynthesis protein TtcA [Methanosaeta sp. PtaB.Bin039]|nr:MAG: tRNA 2-thiocytidine biosynthesis protein TtcA [Methanosaeta sp. PtaB.Bin039]
MIRCDRCSLPSAVHQRYSGLHLCPDHFTADVERKVRETLRTYRLFGRGGLVAVAMSGGKDSSALLYMLKKIFSPRRDIQLVAVLVDEGIDGYREQTLLSARSLADRLKIPHRTLHFSQEFATSTDSMAARTRAEAPCTYCGVLRKNLLNRAAREMGATALATGHNLDDEAQTVLLNYLRGDVERLFRLVPRTPKEGMVPRIKPLRRVPERELAIYAHLHGIYPQGHGSCPYVPWAMRLEIKEILNRLEAGHPGTKYALLRGFDKIQDLAGPGSFQMRQCGRCGEPTGQEVCQSCQLLERLGMGMGQRL